MATVRFSIALPVALRQQLADRCAAEDRSASAVLRRALIAYLREPPNQPLPVVK
jgi:metal-responsive CopG/Arc/MetJ family transcriptional regulator